MKGIYDKRDMEECSNGWTSSIEKLLINWSQQILINEHVYLNYGQKYHNLYVIFGIVIIVIEAGSLMTILNLITQEANKNILIGVAVLQSITIIFQMIDKFFNFGSSSEKYYEAGKNHNALSKFINSTLVLPRKDRGDAREIIISIRNQFNELKNTTPTLPSNKIIHKLDMMLYEDPKEACGDKPEKTIRIGQSKGLFFRSSNQIEKQEAVIELPDITEKVELPKSSAEDLNEKQLIITFKRKESDSDEETVRQQTSTMIREKIQQSKTEASKQQEYNKNFMNIINYQWSRLEEHGEKV